MKCRSTLVFGIDGSLGERQDRLRNSADQGKPGARKEPRTPSRILQIIETTAKPALAGGDRTGWTIGGGLEAAFAPNWTAKVEYLFVDLGGFNCGLNCGAGLVTDNVSFHTNLLRAGVNYKF